MVSVVRASPPVAPGSPHRAVFASGETVGGGGASPINLLTSITDGVQTGALPANWMGGVCHTPSFCDAAELWLHADDPLLEDLPLPDPAVKTIFDRSCDVSSYAFDIPVGVRLERGRSVDEAAVLALAELEALTPAAMASYLAAKVRSLATRPIADTAVSMTVGVGVLFEARGEVGPGGGLLIVPDRARAVAVDKGVIVRGGTRYTNELGGPVAVGPGIPATEPTGGAAPSATQAWVSITSNADYARSPENLGSVTTTLDDAAQNLRGKALVERRALVRLDDCNVFSVLVDLTL